MNQVLTIDDKNQIYKISFERFIYGLKNYELGKFEKRSLANKIVTGIDNAKTLNEIIDFLSNLSKKYLFFEPATIKLKQEINVKKEQEVMDKLRGFLKSYPSSN